jgi:hypothetical protein
LLTSLPKKTDMLPDPAGTCVDRVVAMSCAEGAEGADVPLLGVVVELPAAKSSETSGNTAIDVEAAGVKVELAKVNVADNSTSTKGLPTEGPVRESSNRFQRSTVVVGFEVIQAGARRLRTAAVAIIMGSQKDGSQRQTYCE